MMEFSSSHGSWKGFGVEFSTLNHVPTIAALYPSVEPVIAEHQHNTNLP